MKSNLQIFNTDRVNKYGYRFTAEVLESALSQSWELGSPSFISHDFHRLVGWTRCVGIWTLPSQSALMGLFFYPDKDSEHEIFERNAREYLSAKLTSVDSVDKQKLNAKLKQHLTDDACFVLRECISVLDKDIARKALPDLFAGDEKDKRSLVSLKNLHEIGTGIFEYQGYAVFAHRFFRRSLSQFNNLNEPILSALFELSRKDELDVKIALDPHSLGIPETYKYAIELDYWWGPRFTDSLTDIPSGVTVHQATERQLYFGAISRTEFWWHQQNGIQSLECEEIRDLPSPGLDGDRFGCRYVHSMVNDNGTPFHLDGAIRSYDSASFIDRLDVDISNSGKNTDYYKLWRIDGDIDIPTWKKLISDFYRDNHLIGEYFRGEEINPLALGDSDEVSSKGSYDATLKYVPPVFLPENGVQIFVSYHRPITGEHEEDLHICPTYYLNNGEVRLPTLELGAADYIKLIRKRTGAKLPIDTQLNLAYFEDLDINLPLIICRGHDAVLNANEVFKSLEDFCSDELKRENRVITACIGIEYGDVLVKFSFIFNISALENYRREEERYFPEQFDLIGRWIESQGKTLNSLFPNTLPTIFDQQFLTEIGQFSVDRKFLPHEMIRVSERAEISLAIHESETEILQLVSSGKITAAPMIFVTSVGCDSCGADYLSCDCLLSNGATTSAKGYYIHSLFWTRESAFQAKQDQVAK